MAASTSDTAAAAKTFNEHNIAEFRTTGGTLSAFGDAPVLLLTTTGARSGERRTSPMMYRPDDADPDVVYVFASNAGADNHPAWYYNTLAHPDDVIVEIGRNTVTAQASVVEGADRDRIYHDQAEQFPGFADYERRASRVIPVVALRLHRRPAHPATEDH
jgi:deazaflavin-dependent oxidoreductase (nitroreductase family)